MCAIYSSPNFINFMTLYHKNLERGNFAYGTAIYNEKLQQFLIEKGKGVCDFDNWSDIDEMTFFVGHSQAPTSCVREFDKATSHPFSCNGVIVAHNGVLTNEKQLKEKSIMPYNSVDSSVIPGLIYQKYELNKNIEESICQTLSELEGTYSLWILFENCVYFARSGSTLFMNRETCEISSIKIDNIIEEVPEGILYKLYDITNKQNKITELGKFTVNSPFLII